MKSKPGVPSDAFERDVERDAESAVSSASGLSSSPSTSSLAGSAVRDMATAAPVQAQLSRPRNLHPSNAAISDGILQNQEQGDGWRLSPSIGVDRGFDFPELECAVTDGYSEAGETVKIRPKAQERIRHFTWTWFCMTMATGGVANVMHSVPYRFHGLYAIGCIFFLFNIALFIFNCVMISLRFWHFPATFRGSFVHPTESLFIPAAIISTGTILINITQYGFTSDSRLWLLHVMIIFYWIYCALAVLFSSGIYLLMWSTQTFTIDQMTPVWIFPAYPLLIVGPFAGNLASKLTTISPSNALSILIGGYTLQGIGFLVSLMIYSSFIYRLMTKKLPRESLRPGMFISVGPSGFTIAGIMTMAQQLPAIISATSPSTFMGIPDPNLAASISVVAANWMGLWLWGLALWFFFISIGAHYTCAANGRLNFSMTWYSFIFPNTALTTATFAVANALGGNRGIRIVGYILTVALVITWFLVFLCMIRAVLKKQVLWPQMQEDREEGGWKRDVATEKKWESEREKLRRAGSVGNRVRARVSTMTRGSDTYSYAHGYAVRTELRRGRSGDVVEIPSVAPVPIPVAAPVPSIFLPRNRMQANGSGAG